jgi:hypothetical protein
MILSKAEFLAKIGDLLQDNSTQLISPLDVRTSLTDLADSVHLLLDGNSVVSANFASPETRTTRAGSLALGKLGYQGRSSVDNSAFGYYALGANFDGTQNTAIGSHSLGCNLHGTYNTAVGFNSSAGNTTGSGNVTVGSFGLQTLRTGSFNISIGHGAGNRIGKDAEFKFYLGVDPIDSGMDCQSMSSTSGATPLLYGDLKDLKLGVATHQELHNYGVLQVSGDITSSHAKNFNLGNTNVPWASVNEVIHFSGDHLSINTPAPSGEGKVTVSGNLVPSENGKFSLGWSDGTEAGQKLLWDGYFNDVTVSGSFHCNDININEVNLCTYDCKTLHLATSGVCDSEIGYHNDAFCGFLTDESLDGAGFVTHSSGADYRRNYHFVFRAPDPDLTCLEVDSHYARSRWESNISIQIESGKHLQTDRVLGDDTLSLVTQSGCYGVFIEPSGHDIHNPSGNHGFATKQNIVRQNLPTKKDFNFVAQSGTHLGADGNPSGYDYTLLTGTVDSGVKVAHEFTSRMKSLSASRGFSIVYYDDYDKIYKIGTPPPEPPAGPGAGTDFGNLYLVGDNDLNGLDFSSPHRRNGQGSSVAISLNSATVAYSHNFESYDSISEPNPALWVVFSERRHGHNSSSDCFLKTGQVGQFNNTIKGFGSDIALSSNGLYMVVGSLGSKLLVYTRSDRNLNFISPIKEISKNTTRGFGARVDISTRSHIGSYGYWLVTSSPFEDRGSSTEIGYRGGQDAGYVHMYTEGFFNVWTERSLNTQMMHGRSPFDRIGITKNGLAISSQGTTCAVGAPEGKNTNELFDSYNIATGETRPGLTEQAVGIADNQYFDNGYVLVGDIWDYFRINFAANDGQHVGYRSHLECPRKNTLLTEPSSRKTEFGHSVHIGQDINAPDLLIGNDHYDQYLIVGAPNVRPAGNIRNQVCTGMVFVYKKTAKRLLKPKHYYGIREDNVDWELHATIAPSYESVGFSPWRFGHDVFITHDGNTVVVSSPGYGQENGDTSGKLWIYTYNVSTQNYDLSSAIRGTTIDSKGVDTEPNVKNLSVAEDIAVSDGGEFIVAGCPNTQFTEDKPNTNVVAGVDTGHVQLYSPIPL